MKVVNAALFQGTWFACVLGGWQAGAVGLIGLVGLSIYLGSFTRDVSAAVVLASVGWIFDSSWIALGVLDYASGVSAPVWIVMLWFAVGFTVNHSLSFLQRHLGFAAAAGCCAAPISYLAGERLGAVQVVDPAGLALIAASWAAVFGLTFHLISLMTRESEREHVG